MSNKLVSLKKFKTPRNRGHFRIEKVPGFSVFAMDNSTEEETTVNCLLRCATTSDDPLFYKYINAITKDFLHPLGLFDPSVSQFVVVLHSDLTADVYVNDFAVTMRILRKEAREIKTGEIIHEDDIADITAIEFPTISIKETDRVAVCLKVKWKFALYFDYYREEPLNTKILPKIFANIYRYLVFQDVFAVFSGNTGSYSKMSDDGWFPFSAILGKSFRELSNAYKNDFQVDKKRQEIVSSFNAERFASISQRWWNKPIYLRKKEILEKGISSFLSGDYISCIKNIASEIDGVLRVVYHEEIHEGKAKTGEMLERVIQRGKEKIGSEMSLLLPSQFLKYLQDIIFAHFSLDDETVPLSKHSITHGVAESASYTQEKALQMLLTLDQICYFL